MSRDLIILDDGSACLVCRDGDAISRIVVHPGGDVSPILHALPEPDRASISDAIAAAWTDAVMSEYAARMKAEPQPTIPSEVSMYQARAALIGAGLYDAVNAAVAASTDEIVKVAWEYATVVKRSSPFIAAMSGALGLDDAAIDQLFVTASQIN